jgi:hypothetical protein
VAGRPRAAGRGRRAVARALGGASLVHASRGAPVDAVRERNDPCSPRVCLPATRTFVHQHSAGRGDARRRVRWSPHLSGGRPWVECSRWEKLSVRGQPGRFRSAGWRGLRCAHSCWRPRRRGRPKALPRPMSRLPPQPRRQARKPPHRTPPRRPRRRRHHQRQLYKAKRRLPRRPAPHEERRRPLGNAPDGAHAETGPGGRGAEAPSSPGNGSAASATWRVRAAG